MNFALITLISFVVFGVILIFSFLVLNCIYALKEFFEDDKDQEIENER